MINVDIGIFLVILGLSILGAVLQFWQNRVTEIMHTRFANLETIKTTIKDSKRDFTVLIEFVKASRKQRRRLIKNYINSNRVQLRMDYLDKWSISIFFGLIAGILYALVSPDYLEVGYFLGALLSGYAGENFVLKTLQESNPFEQLNLEDFENYLATQNLAS